MRIIAPECVILDEFEQQSLPARIEFCGRICYKSEDRITSESALPFVRKMLELKHSSVLEMGILTLQIQGAGPEAITSLYACQPRYIQIDQFKPSSLLITGSIRAFRELWQLNPQEELPLAILHFLHARHPIFFEDLSALAKPANAAFTINKIPLAEVDQLPAPLHSKHRYLAVKCVANRAVTHELVRHRPCSFLQESQRYCRYGADKFGNEVTFIKPLFFTEESLEFALWQESMLHCERNYLKLLKTASPQAARTVLPNSCKTEIIANANLSEWYHILLLRTSPAAEPSMREIMLPLLAQLAKRFPMHFSQLNPNAK